LLQQRLAAAALTGSGVRHNVNSLLARLSLSLPGPQGVANRDIKLDNLLLQPVDGLPQPLLLICDFGYSSSQSDSGEARADGFSRVGTLNYVAPEVRAQRARQQPNMQTSNAGSSCEATWQQGRLPSNLEVSVQLNTRLHPTC
jgi:serine/threonine protein kinase